MSSPPPPRARLTLKPGREKALRGGHPWVFSGAVAELSGASSAPLAEVRSHDGELLGTGFLSSRSQIRARLVRRDDGAVDRAFFAERLERALALRRDFVPPETTAYRVLNAEGDGVPGWTVDCFGAADGDGPWGRGVLVSQVTSAGLEALRHDAYDALRDAFPGFAVLQSNRLPARRQEGLSQADEVVVPPADGADGLPEEVEILESGLRFWARPGGQKTGFYLDQRDSRRRVERLAGGRRVLDLFAHGGAFSVYALRGGSESVTTVESSAAVLALARRHVERNGLDPGRLETVRADVFEDLRRRRERYGLVVCDPPPLVKRKAHLRRGARAYQDLNRLALGRVDVGGYFLTWSCSGAVDPKLFRQILFAAAGEAGRRVQLLHPLGPGADHPVDLAHPQGDYLDGWLCRVVE